MSSACLNGAILKMLLTITDEYVTQINLGNLQLQGTISTVIIHINKGKRMGEFIEEQWPIMKGAECNESPQNTKNRNKNRKEKVSLFTLCMQTIYISSSVCVYVFVCISIIYLSSVIYQSVIYLSPIYHLPSYHLSVIYLNLLTSFFLFFIQEPSNA